MQSELIRVIPEFGQIRDADLKSKTLACWVDAMQIGNWSIDDLDIIPFTLLIPNCQVSFRTHTRAVTKTAIECAKILDEYYRSYYQMNPDHIVSGGLLHDIGKLLEFKKAENRFIKSDHGKLLRHPFSGAALATKHGLPDVVVHIIATHANEGDGAYRCPEAVVIHHADFMNFEPLQE